MKRNPNIELWRILCMFAVVLCHVVYVNHLSSTAGYQWHIPGFLLISGYFGIRFSFRKVFKLIFMAYACYWLTIPLHPSTNSLLSLLLPHCGWFLPFYCALMILSPILNAALENAKHRKAILVSTCALVVMGWIPTLIHNVHAGMIAIPGMQGNGMLLMMATYVFGAMLRIYAVDKKLHIMVWLACFVGGIIFCYLMRFILPSACHYLSPLSIATAASGFMFFVSMRPLPLPVGRVMSFISPSMFGVYLLHECCIEQYQYFTGGGTGSWPCARPLRGLHRHRYGAEAADVWWG